MCAAQALHLLPPLLTSSACTDALLVWAHLDYWPSENILLLRAEAETSRDGMLHWRYPTGVHEVRVHRDDRGDIWLLEPVWVCGTLFFFRKRKFELMIRFRLQRLLPCGCDVPASVTIYRQLPVVAIHSTCKSALTNVALVRAKLWQVVDRIAGSRPSAV